MIYCYSVQTHFGELFKAYGNDKSNCKKEITWLISPMLLSQYLTEFVELLDELSESKTSADFYGVSVHFSTSTHPLTQA